MKPQALKNGVNRADKLIAEAAKARADAQPPAVSPQNPEQPPEQPPEQTPEAPAQAASGFGHDQTPPAQQPAAPAASPEPPREDFEQRYRVLQGKYNAELPRAREELDRVRRDAAEAARRADDLQRQIDELKRKPAVQLVTDKEREEFGEDLLDVAARNTLARPEIARLIEDNQKLTVMVSSLEAKLGATNAGVVKTARERMFDALDAKVPNWRNINKDQAFLDWLALEDGFSGIDRMTLLRSAYDENDAARVARFFTTYVSETSADTRPSRIDPKDFVSPGQTRTPAPAKPDDQKITWTPSSIDAFYRDKLKGVYAKNPEEAARLERDIFAAQREGRIS